MTSVPTSSNTQSVPASISSEEMTKAGSTDVPGAEPTSSIQLAPSLTDSSINVSRTVSRTNAAGGGSVTLDEASAMSGEPQNYENELNLLLLVASTIPVLSIMGAKVICDSFSLFTLYFFMQANLMFCDINLVIEVAKGQTGGFGSVRLYFLLITIFLSSTFIPLQIWTSFPDLLPVLYFMKPVQLVNKDGDFWTVAFVVTTACLLIKLVSLGVKTIVALLPMQPGTHLSAVGKKRIYRCIELGSQLYCECIPILPWWRYLRTAGETPALQNLSILIALFYINFKLVKITKLRYPKLQASLTELRTDEPESMYGKATKTDQLTENQKCPICLDVLSRNNPVTVACQHIFCSVCLTRWIEGEKKTKCPVCRKKVLVNDIQWIGAESKAVVFAF